MFHNSNLRRATVLIAFFGAAMSQADLITFDSGQANGNSIGAFYSAQGVTFSAGTWVDNFGVPGSSGAQGLAGADTFPYIIPPAAPIVITFTQPVSSASIQACDVGFAGAIMNAYDAPTGGNLVASASYVGVGAGIGYFTQLTTNAASIYRLELSQQNNNGGNGDGLLFDDLQYTPVPVPEPASIAALGFGALAMFRRRARK